MADRPPGLPAPAIEKRALFVCAPGAGGHMNDAQMLRTVAALEPLGIEVVRFNFAYRSRGSRRPDPMPVLRERYETAVADARRNLGARPLIIGGRSMGGRVATMLAADGFACDALLLFAYPLHPAGQPEKLRDAHLPRIRVPVLCFNGTRDALCRRDLMERALQNVGPNWRMHWLEGADHSLKGDKVMAEIAAAVAAWLPGVQAAA
ncbi:MAG TPA: alpha/beta family hydrolase [Burkholderiales bacterium]|nr:alpha/beta family hydrolase [Burkholderiales bacterium]